MLFLKVCDILNICFFNKICVFKLYCPHFAPTTILFLCLSSSFFELTYEIRILIIIYPTKIILLTINLIIYIMQLEKRL